MWRDGMNTRTFKGTVPIILPWWPWEFPATYEAKKRSFVEDQFCKKIQRIHLGFLLFLPWIHGFNVKTALHERKLIFGIISCSTEPWFLEDPGSSWITLWEQKTGGMEHDPSFLKAKTHHLNQPATQKMSFAPLFLSSENVVLGWSYHAPAKWQNQKNKQLETQKWELGRLFSHFAHSTLALKTTYPLRNPSKFSLPITHPKLQGKQHPLETKKRAPCLKPFVVRKQVSLYYQPKLHALLKGNRSKCAIDLHGLILPNICPI